MHVKSWFRREPRDISLLNALNRMGPSEEQYRYDKENGIFAVYLMYGLVL